MVATETRSRSATSAGVRYTIRGVDRDVRARLVFIVPRGSRGLLSYPSPPQTPKKLARRKGETLRTVGDEMKLNADMWRAIRLLAFANVGLTARNWESLFDPSPEDQGFSTIRKLREQVERARDLTRKVDVDALSIEGDLPRSGTPEWVALKR